MSDDLVTRCVAEVRQAMLDEWHDHYKCDCFCGRDARLAATLGRMMAAEYRRGWADARIDAGYVPPKCERGGTA